MDNLFLAEDVVEKKSFLYKIDLKMEFFLGGGLVWRIIGRYAITRKESATILQPLFLRQCYRHPLKMIPMLTMLYIFQRYTSLQNTTSDKKKPEKQ